MIGIIQSKKAEKRRRKISDSQNRLHQQVERAFLRSYKSWLNRVVQDILGRLESFGTTQVSARDLFVPSLHSRSFSEKLLPRWNLVVWSGVQFEADWIDSQEARQSLVIARQALQLPGEMEPPPSINVDPSPGLMRSVRDYMRGRQVGVWGQVTATTHKTLDRTIRKAIEKGDNLDQMTARVRGVLSNYSDYQARRVARTETTTGMNHGGQIERDELGIEEKEWVSTIDARNRGADASSRFDHLTPDGQVVANGKAFVVSGQELMYPGDSSRGASAGNVIHCRCSAVASFGKGTQPPPKPVRKVKPKKPKTPKEKTPDIKPIAPQPEPPDLGKRLEKKPAHITYSGKEPSEFAEKVWQEVGPDGIQSEEQARRVGRLVREQVEKHPAVAEAKRELEETRKKLAKAEADREKYRKALVDAETDEDAGKFFVKFDKADNEASKWKARIGPAEYKVNQAYPDAARETLAEVRDMGYSIDEFRKKASPDFTGGTVGPTKKVLETLPHDWGKSIEEWAASGTPVKIGKVQRGYFSQYGREIKTSGTGERLESTMLHEFTHAAERNHKINGEARIAKLEKEFLERRRKGETLSTIYAGTQEKGYKDDFLDHYMGKDYGHGMAYEVLTMGTESVFYYHPDRNVWSDADMMEFILGILAGM